MSNKEAVNHPDHYGGADNPYEAIKVIKAWGLGFSTGNAVKYIARAGKKDTDKEGQDLRKAIWYLQDRVDDLEGRKEKSVQLTAPQEKAAPEITEMESLNDEYLRRLRLGSNQRDLLLKFGFNSSAPIPSGFMEAAEALVKPNAYRPALLYYTPRKSPIKLTPFGRRVLLSLNKKRWEKAETQSDQKTKKVLKTPDKTFMDPKNIVDNVLTERQKNLLACMDGREIVVPLAVFPTVRFLKDRTLKRPSLWIPGVKKRQFTLNKTGEAVVAYLRKINHLRL